MRNKKIKPAVKPWAVGEKVWYLLSMGAKYRVVGPVRIAEVDRSFGDVRLRLSDNTASRVPGRFVYRTEKAARAALPARPGA